MASQLLATKSIAELHQADSSEEHKLNRALSAWSLTALGIGGIIGAGIFVLTGTAAANFAGPGLALSFIIAGIGCALAGLCYAEFAAMIPVSGSAYSYSYATLGEGVAWFIGWNLVLEYLFAVATVSAGWSGYAISLLNELNIHIPDFLAKAPLGQAAGSGFAIVHTSGLINLPAMLIVGLVATVCYIGIRQSSTVNAVAVAIKVTIVVLVILFGVGYIQPANYHPFIPDPVGGTFSGHYGVVGILRASGVIFFAYIGFDAISTASQEAKNPQRDMPIGILASLMICTVLYVAMALVLTGMVNYKELNVAAPVAVALDHYAALRWLRIPVKVGAVAGLTSVMLVMTLAQARIFYSMARDGLLPPFFARVHPKFKTPSTGTAITGILAAIIGGILPVDVLGEIVSIGTLAAFVTVCLGVLVLRRTRPDLPRPFRTPWAPVVCPLGAAICFLMIVFLGPPNWVRLVIWSAIGAAIYASYGYRHSRVRQTAQERVLATQK